MEISINVKERATNDLQRLEAKLQSEELKASIGSRVAATVMQHFTKLNSERPNALGGTRTNFYSQAADSTTWEGTETGVKIRVPLPIGLRQRILGGTIEPKPPRKYLTIPAIAEAYGHLAGEFSNLVPVYRYRDGSVRAIALAEAQATPVNVKKQRKSGGASRSKTVGGLIYFWLVPSVYQNPDPTVAPSEAAIRETALGAVDEYFAGLQGNFGGID